MMLEERTFYFTEMQRGEVCAGLPEAGSEGWQDEVDMRIDRILRRAGVDATAVTYSGVPEGTYWVIRALVRVVTQEEFHRQVLDTPLPPPEEMLAGTAQDADSGDDPDG